MKLRLSAFAVIVFLHAASSTVCSQSPLCCTGHDEATPMRITGGLRATDQ
jgi:hypothetical protein